MTAKPRDPTLVIDRVIECIPKDKSILIAELKRIKSNAFYVSPENMNRIWRNIAVSLEQYLNLPPQHDWELKIVSIMQGKE
jgi:hypothetical protein